MLFCFLSQISVKLPRKKNFFFFNNNILHVYCIHIMWKILNSLSTFLALFLQFVHIVIRSRCYLYHTAVNENETSESKEFVYLPSLTFCYGCGRPEPTLEGVHVADAGLNERSGRQPPAGQCFATVFPRSTTIPSRRAVGHRTLCRL